MAVRGQEAKNQLGNVLLNIFSGSFVCPDGKTIRIPIKENGEIIEIKITMTAAKDIIGGEPFMEQSAIDTLVQTNAEYPTEEELAKVKMIMEQFGLLEVYK